MGSANIVMNLRFFSDILGLDDLDELGKFYKHIYKIYYEICRRDPDEEDSFK